MSFYTKPITMLPGGLPFTDPVIPKKHFGGMEVSSEDEQIKRIIAWRTQNKASYPDSKWFDFEMVRLELRAYQTNRLGNSRQFFTQGTNSNFGMEIKVSGPSGACSCGATDASPVFCRTCSRSKVVGYKCNSCGKQRGV